jgi:beta-lactamase superfamily II metal-dependent hydrolase
LVLTHGHAPHVGGALGVLDDFQPAQIVESYLTDRSPARRGFHAELERRRRGKGLYERGDRLEITPEATLRVLFPPSGLQRTAAADKAIVLMLEYRGVRLLFMGESGFATEQWLLENEPDLHADLLIKGRNPRDLSGTADFLRRVAPQAMICPGATPLRPGEKPLQERGIALFDQQLTGAVRVTVADGQLTLSGFLGAQTFRSRAR